MVKEWVLKEQLSEDLEKHLLFTRGIKTPEEAEKFFHPDYEKDLRDPFAILGMDKAAERILRAVKGNEKILIFGDYDADGVCGTVVMSEFFKKIDFSNFSVYIPDRYKEGYGLTLESVNQFKKDGVGLIITIDCGIRDIDEITEAGKMGIDVVVLDHHPQGEKIPPAVAVVDPKREGDGYPFKMLCGAGVAFKTVEALLKRGNFNVMKGWSKWLLDVVALATVADMVSLIDENRVLTFYGLEVLRKTRRIGLLSLYKKLQIEKEEINEDDIAFFLAPRINTASRMDHAVIGFSLLSTENPEEASWLAGRISEKNAEQKQIAENIFNEVDGALESRKTIPDMIIMGDEKWPPGVLPITANRILEKYNKPVFLWGKADGLMIKGSARSNGSVNLVSLLNEVGEALFVDWGGHVLASGFTLKEDKKEDLEKALVSVYRKYVVAEVKDILWMDKELTIEEVNWDLFCLVKKFSPFGVDNGKPVFLFRNLEVFEAKTFGNGGIHFKLNFKKKNGEITPAVGFFMQRRLDFIVEKGMKIDLAASVEKNVFNGHTELRLKIADMRLNK